MDVPIFYVRHRHKRTHRAVLCPDMLIKPFRNFLIGRMDPPVGMDLRDGPLPSRSKHKASAKRSPESLNQATHRCPAVESLSVHCR
jgi:hypothetical protein